MPDTGHQYTRQLADLGEVKVPAASQARNAATLRLVSQCMAEYSEVSERITGEELRERAARVCASLRGRSFVTGDGQRIEIGEFLGNGVRGIVMAGTSPDRAPEGLAIKFTEPFARNARRGGADRDSFSENFYNETEALSRLRAAKNGDVPLLESSGLIHTGRSGDVVGVTVMSRLRGTLLDREFLLAISSGEGLPLLSARTASMLEAAHRVASCGIAAEDIGVTNAILPVNEPAAVKLFDFGNVRFPASVKEALAETARFTGEGLGFQVETALFLSEHSGNAGTLSYFREYEKPAAALARGDLSLLDAAARFRQLA